MSESKRSKPARSKSPKQDQELLETCQRLQAEFENYKKRVENERGEWVNHGKRQLLLALLPVVDNMSIALKAHPGDDEFSKGMGMIHAQLLSTLEEQGVVRIDAKGQTFDPRLHEAMLTEERDDMPQNTVLEVLMEGYAFKGAPLRTAKVKVSKNTNQKEQKGSVDNK